MEARDYTSLGYKRANSIEVERRQRTSHNEISRLCAQKPKEGKNGARIKQAAKQALQLRKNSAHLRMKFYICFAFFASFSNSNFMHYIFFIFRNCNNHDYDDDANEITKKKRIINRRWQLGNWKKTNNNNNEN